MSMFAGLGNYLTEVKVENGATHAFFHRRGVRRMKQLDSRILWLQALIAAGSVRLNKISRTQNFVDMLTNTPGAEKLEVLRDKEWLSRNITNRYRSRWSRNRILCRVNVEEVQASV